MGDQSKPARHYFTDTARAAGAEARRLKRENASPKRESEMFVVRVPPTSNLFTWEVRRFGSIVLKRGTDRFATAAEAKAAGEVELGGEPGSSQS